MEIDHTNHKHDFYEVTVTSGPAICKGCKQTLTPIVLYLHPDQKDMLEWLEKDRKKNANTIIEHFINLEYGKRQRSATQHIRKPKA